MATASGGTSQLFAKGVAVCKEPAHPKAGVNFCDAMRLAFVKASTLGARPYTPLRVSLGSAANALTIGAAGGLTPLDLRDAYKLTGTGAGQTVAIVDAYNDPRIAVDLAAFSTHYSIPCSSCLSVFNEHGLASPLPANDSTGWSVEETLDVEAVHSICPSCHIDLLEANTPNDSDLGTAVNAAVTVLHANEVTNSYGGPEGNNSTFQAAFNHPGTVITASTGDNGYEDWDKLISGGTNVPQTPAAFPTVVAVGGTSLFLGGTSTPTRANETVWNDNGPEGVNLAMAGVGLGAGGGGCSTLFAAQTWQTHVANWATTGCGTKRLDADVSAIADPSTGFDIYDSYTCAHGCIAHAGWETLGGTSLASPVVAAIFALAGGAHGVQYPASTLYAHIASAYDVTTGGNGFCDGMGPLQCNGLGTLGTLNPNVWDADGIMDCAWTKFGVVVAAGDRACDAAPGYDGPSGVGAPNGLAMFTG